MTLSYKDKLGYYGLRVEPSYEEMLQSIRKPIRIQVPSRSARWYATSIYRDYLMGAAEKFHDYQLHELEYDAQGNHLPAAAARTAESMAGNDRAWQEHERFNKALDHEEAYQIAQASMETERKKQATSARKQQLSSYGPSMVHPTLEAHHKDLEYRHMPHPAPVPKPQMHKLTWDTQPQDYIADGHPQAAEFPTFEELNMAQDKRFRQGRLVQQVNQNYQQLRENFLGRKV